MERRRYGKTDMTTSVVGFGSSEIGFEGAEQTTVETLLNEALDTGLNIIDTAECYVDAEEKIGKAVGHRRDDYYLFTKCGHASHTGIDLPDWSAELIRASIDNSLRRLKTDHVDMIHLHSCGRDVLEQGDVVKELLAARDAGKTRYVGYSGDSVTARYALEMGVFDSLQTSVNFADQESIELTLPYCVEHGIGVVAKRPVANVAWRNGDREPDSGYAMTYWRRLQKLRYAFLNRPLPETLEIALRFTLAQPGVCTMIVGTKNPARWAANAASVAKGPLPTDEIAAIRARWTEVREPDWVGQG